MSFTQSFDSFLTGNGLSGGLPSSNLQTALDAVSQGLQFAGPVGQAGSALVSSAQGIANMFGKGRREADIIVPVQEQYGSLLEAVNAQMRGGALTREQLIQYQNVVATGYATFDRFTRDPQFTDGRASVQARNTIRPLVDGRNDNGSVVRADGGTLGNLQAMIDARGGGGYYVQTDQGLVSRDPAAPFTSASVFIAPAVSALGLSTTPGAMLPSTGQKNNTLLLAGGGLLAAKLFGFL